MDQSHRFDGLFKELTGNAPFPWQRRLFDDWLSVGRLPPAVDIPTGLGKTSVMAVWLLARAGGAALPRRLVYVVDRRAVVDQATDCAKTLRDNLGHPDIAHVRQGLGLDERKLPISTLRGRYADNREWLEDPAAPAIVVGTVDMIGSRLLFSGYGVSRKMRPYQAGFMGADTLVVVDEAHLVPPFERLLRTIAESREFTGPAATPAWPPPFRILPLSATLRGGSESEPFRLGCDDLGNEAVRKRLRAVKTLIIEDMDADAQLEEVLAERAWRLGGEETGNRGAPARKLLIYCNSRETARKVEEDLRRRAEGAADTILFVGGRRMRDREEDVKALNDHGFLADSGVTPDKPVFLVATSAGEVGVDLDADHMVCDLVPWERMVQRLGRVNRRGAGTARVLVVDQGAPDGKKGREDEIARRQAVRKLLEALPRTEAGGHDASPAALDRLQKETGAEGVAEASTRPPLYPALSRPLVDAWAMTSLVDHTGRPEVAPWLRGWVDDEPQTTVIWRRCLPLRFVAAEMQKPNPGEIETFFDAAPPQTVELLETETWAVVDWLKKRAGRVLKSLDKDGKAESRRDRDDGEAAAGDQGYDLLQLLDAETPVVFVLGESRGSKYPCLTLADIRDRSSKDLGVFLAGQRLVADARIGGLEHGLLEPSHCEYASTIENSWGDSEIPEDSLPEIRVRVLSDDAREKERGAAREDSGDGPNRWQESFAAPYRLSEDGEETEVWLVVDEGRGKPLDEDTRAMTPKPQGLADHQERVAREAKRIAEAIGLPPPDRAMLVAAARHHDDGKRAELWQRAFNAKREGRPWAKTSGPLNRHVLGGYRHEFQSVLDAEKDGLDGLNRSDPRFDLALHLMAAHHGYARPVIAVEGCDGLPPSAAAGRAREVGRRFARLQRRWGPWGLAWWEALLRAADQRASRESEAAARRGAG